MEEDFDLLEEEVAGLSHLGDEDVVAVPGNEEKETLVVVKIAQTPSECLFGDPYLQMFQIHFQLHCQVYLFRQLHPRTPQGLYGGQ